MLYRMGRVTYISAAVLAVSAIFVSSAAAALQGPFSVVPGGLGTGHGGNTCYSTNPLAPTAGPEGKGPGQTHVYGGDTDTTPQSGCAFDGAPPAPTAFDTTRFDALYWGVSGLPALALDGDIDEANETMTLAPNTGAPASDYANGRVVWTGTTDMHWCNPSACPTFQTTLGINTRLVLTIRDQTDALVSLTDALTVEG